WYAGFNNSGDVVQIQYLLHQLIMKKKLLGAKVWLSGLCDEKTIEAIRLFQCQTGCSLPDGRVDPYGNTLKVMNQAGGYKRPVQEGWAYFGSTSWGIGGSVEIGILSLGGGFAGMALFVTDSSGSNRFKVICYGGQITGGIGLGSPVSLSVDYSTKD